MQLSFSHPMIKFVMRAARIIRPGVMPRAAASAGLDGLNSAIQARTRARAAGGGPLPAGPGPTKPAARAHWQAQAQSPSHESLKLPRT